MASMKNEHIIYAYVPLIEGDNLLLVGITDIGWEYLKGESGNFLKADPPGVEFSRVRAVWVVRGKDKAEIREMLKTVARQKGVPLHEAH